MEDGIILTTSSRLTTEELFEIAKNLYKAGYTWVEVKKSKSPEQGKAYGIAIRYGREDQKVGKP